MATVTITPKNESKLSVPTQNAIDLINELCLEFMIDDIVSSTQIPVANVEYENDGEVIHFMVCLNNDKFNLCYGFTNCDDYSTDIVEFELEIFNNETQEWDYHYCEDIDEVNDLL